MRWLALWLGLASSAAADVNMSLETCQTGWRAVQQRLYDDVLPPMLRAEIPPESATETLTLSLTDDGWCRMVRADDLTVQAFDWQAEGVAAFAKDGTPPLALRIRAHLEDIYTDTTGPFDLVLALRRVPGTGQLLVETLTLTPNSGEPALVLTALITGAYMDSLASGFSSFGGVTLSQVAGQMRLDAAAPHWPQDDLRDTLADLVAGLSTDQLPADSNAALTALIDALPDATGTVTFNARSARGLGWLQVVTAAGRAFDATRSEVISFALSGVVIDAQWSAE